MVLQEKEICIRCRCLGKIKIYTKKSYRSIHGVDPEDHGLKAENWVCPTGESLSVYKAGEAPVVPEEDQDQDLADALNLGLEVDQQPSKKRRTSGPRVKKSREEVFQEEAEKLAGRLEELIASLGDTSGQFPTVAACAKLLRPITSKMEEAKTSGCFEVVTELDGLAQKLNLVKEALRVSNLYILPSGNVKKTQEENFIAGFQALPPALLAKFPAQITDRFHHLDVRELKWAEALEHIRVASASEQAVPMVELLVSKMLEQDDHLELLTKYLPVLEKMEDFPEPLQAGLELISSIVLQNLRGAETFDSVLESLKMAEKDVVVRVLHSDSTGNGKNVIARLQAANQHLQTRFSKALEMTKIKNRITSMDLSDLSDWSKVVMNAAELGITSEDLSLVSLAEDTKEVCCSLLAVGKKKLEEIDLDSALSCLYEDEAMDASAMIVFGDSANDIQILSDLLNSESVVAMMKLISMDHSALATQTRDMCSLAPWLLTETSI
eukprot:s157_g27.t1